MSVMTRLSVFLRSTYFEDDSVLAREMLVLALDTGVASDTGFRSDGVRQFEVGDCTDLCQRVDTTLSQVARN